MAVLNACKAIGMKTVPFVSLDDRIAFVNHNVPAGDYLIEVHVDIQDSAPGTDCGVYYYDGNAWSQDTGRVILELWKTKMGHTGGWLKGDKEARQGRLGIVRDTNCPAWLLEMFDIDDVAKRNLAISNGAMYLKSIQDAMNGHVPFDQPSEWAKASWDKAVAKKIVNGERPQDMILDSELQTILQRLGALDSVSSAPLTRERLIVALDRLHDLD